MFGVEESISHGGQKPFGHRQSGSIADDRIDSALRAKCRTVIIGPLVDIFEFENIGAIEAPAQPASGVFRVIVRRMCMSAKEVDSEEFESPGHVKSITQDAG